MLWPRAVEPFHTHKCKEKRRRRRGARGLAWQGRGKLLVGGQGSAFRTRKQRGDSTEHVSFKRSDCRKKPEPSLVEHVVFVCEEGKYL